MTSELTLAKKWRHCLFYLQHYFSALGTVLTKSFTEAFSSNGRLDVREVNDGNCNVVSIIYQAEVTSQTTKETYIGLCDTPFKLRHRNHTSSFRSERYRNATELSKHVWNLKDQNIQYDIKWRKIKHAWVLSQVWNRVGRIRIPLTDCAARFMQHATWRQASAL